MHSSKHLEGCTHQSISKDAHIKTSRRRHLSEHPEGCEQSISKDANIKASRRMHRSKHLEGCTFQSTSKDENKTSRRLHPEGQIEGYAQKGNPKGAIIGLERILYTLKSFAKVDNKTKVTTNHDRTSISTPQRCIQDEQG